MGDPTRRRATVIRSEATLDTPQYCGPSRTAGTVIGCTEGTARLPWLCMDNVRWRERPELRSPVLVCAFKGWNDAGEAATAALGFLVDSFDARVIADIDPEEFYDFTAVRPTVSMDEGTSRVIEWPANTLHAASVPGTDHDLLLLQGIEPSLRWREFTAMVIEMARELGARMVVTLGALLADVPHTRAVPMTGICSDPDLIERLG